MGLHMMLRKRAAKAGVFDEAPYTSTTAPAMLMGVETCGTQVHTEPAACAGRLWRRGHIHTSALPGFAHSKVNSDTQ